MRKKTKKFQTLFSTVAVLSILSAGLFPAKALAGPLGTIADISPGDIKTAQAQAGKATDLVTADQLGAGTTSAIAKQGGPSVQVTFTTTGPFVKGSSVTASASSAGFDGASDPSKLYFTWYIKKTGCELSDSLDDSNRKCDVDGDGEITVNDWKVSASRIIVKGDFQKADADYVNAVVDDSAAGIEAVPSVDQWAMTTDPSIDNGNSDNIPNCYVQETKSGAFFELRKTEDVFEPCPSGKHRACAQDASTSCADPDPANPAIDGLNFCQITAEADDNNQGADDNLVCQATSLSDLQNFRASATCDDGGVGLCIPDTMRDADSSPNDVLGNVSSNAAVFGQNAPISEICTTALTVTNDTITPALFGQSNSATCGSSAMSFVNTVEGLGKQETTPYKPSCTFIKKENICKHLFPYFPENQVTVDGKKIDLSDVATGDGSFGLEEKEFWGANPDIANTAGKNKDEAMVMGLGVNSFTWTYVPGDMVGVAVEGVSTLPTKHNDASKMIMWAFSKNQCSALEQLRDKEHPDNAKRAYYIEDSSNSGTAGVNEIGILTADVDLNDCLEENLMDPDATGLTHLSVNVSAMPQNPINDPAGNGDTVTTTAAASNTQDYAGLSYDWKIEKSMDGGSIPTDETSWVDITSDMLALNSFSAADQSGLGKNSFAFNLNLPDALLNKGLSPDSLNNGAFYLRARVNIAENSGEANQSTKGMVIIKAYKQKNSIAVSSAIADSEGMLSLDPTKTLCNNSAGATACAVSKNEIIGLTVPDADVNNFLTNFSWKINGNDWTCDSAVSFDCFETHGNTLFFPVQGNTGELISVNATAINSSTGDHIDVTKNFIITEPSVSIVSADQGTVMPKVLGFYKDLDGNKFPDYSESVLETIPGKIIKLNAIFSPAWKEQQSNYIWSINGMEQADFSNKNEISIDTSKNIAGDSFTVDLAGTFKAGASDQLTFLQKALYKNWQISQQDVVDETSSASVQVNVVSPQVFSQPNNGEAIPMGASLISHLPEQAGFLLKIILTALLMLIAVGALFSIMPERIFEEKNTPRA